MATAIHKDPLAPLYIRRVIRHAHASLPDELLPPHGKDLGVYQHEQAVVLLVASLPVRRDIYCDDAAGHTDLRGCDADTSRERTHGRQEVIDERGHFCAHPRHGGGYFLQPGIREL
jgi:hypothetical protein